MVNTMENEERRVITGELRAVGEGDAAPTKIVGYAARFNSLSEDLGGFRERIAPGAFANAILTCDVRALWNHDANIVLGRNMSGTLRLQENEDGLYYECDPPNTQLVRDMVMAPIGRGDVNQCSFGFRTILDKWEEIAGETIRTLIQVDLFDVSPVTYPAYPTTDVAVRSLQQVRANEAWRIDVMRRRLTMAEMV